MDERRMPYHDPQRMDEELDTSGDDTAALVRQAVAGDDAAFGRLYDEWFDRVFDAAAWVVRDRAAAADIAQDAFLRAWRSIGSLRDPELFGGWLLRIARNAALNHVRREARAGAVDSEGLEMIERAGSASPTAPAGFGVEERVGRAEDPATAVEDAELVGLVQESVEALDGRDAEVLHLGLRYGLTPAEIGEAVGLNRNAANQAVHRARRHLRTAIEARVLWHGGAPRCDRLAAVLNDAGVDRFDARAIDVVSTHAADCDICAEHRRLRLEPAALFGAVPLVSAPALLKSKVALALSDAGVPMTGSSSGPPAPGSGGTPGAHGDGQHPPDGSATDSNAAAHAGEAAEPGEPFEPVERSRWASAPHRRWAERSPRPPRRAGAGRSWQPGWRSPSSRVWSASPSSPTAKRNV